MLKRRLCNSTARDAGATHCAEAASVDGRSAHHFLRSFTKERPTGEAWPSSMARSASFLASYAGALGLPAALARARARERERERERARARLSTGRCCVTRSRTAPTPQLVGSAPFPEQRATLARRSVAPRVTLRARRSVAPRVTPRWTSPRAVVTIGWRIGSGGRPPSSQGIPKSAYAVEERGEDV